jgi:hypothetical protein
MEQASFATTEHVPSRVRNLNKHESLIENETTAPVAVSQMRAEMLA